GEGALVLHSFARLFCAAIAFALIASSTASVQAAGALAVGKCGAYGHAYDFKEVGAAMLAARKQCEGHCKTIPMKRGCAALSIDLSNPCGAHGYAVAPRISKAQNNALRSCYGFGGKECVIRAWACDVRG